jgi:hypothetical protein
MIFDSCILNPSSSISIYKKRSSKEPPKVGDFSRRCGTPFTTKCITFTPRSEDFSRRSDRTRRNQSGISFAWDEPRGHFLTRSSCSTGKCYGFSDRLSKTRISLISPGAADRTIGAGRAIVHPLPAIRKTEIGDIRTSLGSIQRIPAVAG